MEMDGIRILQQTVHFLDVNFIQKMMQLQSNPEKIRKEILSENPVRTFGFLIATPECVTVLQLEVRCQAG